MTYKSGKFQIFIGMVKFILSIFFICTLIIKGQNNLPKIDQSNLNWNIQIENALKLIEKTDDLRFSVLKKVCREIKLTTDKDYTSKDSVLLLYTEIFDENSINLLACVIVFESKKLEIETWKTEMTDKKKKYFCYLTEYAFFTKLKDGEEWLKDFLVQMMIDYQ